MADVGSRHTPANDQITAAVERWRAERLREDYEKLPPRQKDVTTLSGLPVEQRTAGC